MATEYSVIETINRLPGVMRKKVKETETIKLGAKNGYKKDHIDLSE